ncbi:MAG: hypothetical protein WA584_02475 [Pyrinomonadaceae bacterium]
MKDAEIGQWIIKEDESRFEDRLERLKWVVGKSPQGENAIFHSSIAQSMFNECRYCFVYEQFLASIILGMSFIEHTLSSILFSMGRDDLKRAKMSIILKEALKIDLITKAEYKNLVNASAIRNAVVHFREPKESLFFKAIAKDKEPYEFIENDAKKVLEVVLVLYSKSVF